ncbi:MAG: alkaline phosphatase [Oligosphaeraceae bacterium]
MSSRLMRFLAVWCLLCVCALGADSPKYVFLFIGDGMSLPQRTLAESFLKRTAGEGQELLINHLPVRASTRTSSANALITDSAASGTAIACGEKTNNGVIGLAPDGKRPLESMAYVAQRSGRRVGIVTSVTINHATPSAFYGHRPNRSQYYELGLDLVASNFDYFAGGGCAKNDDSKNPAYKGDIYELAKQAGYTVTSTREEFERLAPGVGKVFARGADGALPAAIDRDKQTIELHEFVVKGIELLDNPKGFFLMCEGGAIDWRGHANDAAGSVHESLALDKAVKVAYEFAKRHPAETLIVVTGDHETGALTLGFANTGYEERLELLARQSCSVDRFNGVLREQLRNAGEQASFETCGVPALRRVFGLDFEGKGPLAVQEAELESLRKAYEASVAAWKAKKGMDALKLAGLKLFNNKCGAVWHSGGHSALPVITTAYGVGSERFAGDYENTYLAVTLKGLLAR